MTTLAPPRRGHHPGIALALIVTCQLMLVLDATVVNVALPDIRKELDFTNIDLSWLVNAYALPFGGLLLLGGRAGDILGRRRVFLVGTAAFTLASLLGGLASTSGLLLAARVGQGIAGALAAPSALSLIASNFDEGRERTRAMSVYAGVTAAAGSFGLVIGGLLISSLSWRSVFFINIPFGIAIMVLVPSYLSETERHTGRFDALGALLSTVGMTAMVYGFIGAASNGWTTTSTAVAFVVAVVSLAAFIRLENSARQPIMPLHLFADRNRAGAYGARLLLIAGMFGMFFFLSQFTQDVLNYTPLQTGFAFLPNTVAMYVSSRFAERLLPRFGTKRLALVGISTTALGMVWLTQLSEHSGYFTHVFGPMVLLGTGIGLPLVALTLASLSGVESKDSGAASGMVSVIQQVGGSLGLSILVTIFGFASRQAAAHPRSGLSGKRLHDYVLAHGMSRAFAGAAAFAVLAVVVVAITIQNASGKINDEQLASTAH